ncbi:hypothetical protein PFISCL1PPCAC_5150 [Pristionchus fissidentatus]|uniref:Pseudouridine synthase n=1 Tax=Pristionchus fissidentatus TaxID=1538716 RepID=A0AAV5V687_9BILA|nr:hypothetical protein PFISCL1PPCAC_5150 [Pristionchus fissidentatus]
MSESDCVSANTCEATVLSDDSKPTGKRAATAIEQERPEKQPRLEDENKEESSVEETQETIEKTEEQTRAEKEADRLAKKKERASRQSKFAFDEQDDVPMNVPVTVKNGVRHLAPYWTVYRTRAKGRWFGRKLVEVFSQEFLSTNRNYARVATRLGRIWVNGRQMRDVDYVISNNDVIEHWGHRHEHPILDEEIRIVADTPSLLVIDKPASMPVHACGQYALHTILGQLRVRYGITGLRVLHRLDRTTSGILMFARDYDTDREFKGTLKEGEWKKEYVCRVQGVFPEEEVEVKEPIGTLIVSMGIQCIRPDGKHALTRFRRMWTDGKESVVRAEIETGRTHQIRVHLQYLGYPIVNDKLYNCPDIWPNAGKGADFGGMGYEELGARVQQAHKSSLWHETVNEDYAEKMERLATQDELELAADEPEITRAQRPDYDPICLSCNVTKKEVPMDHFRIYLHCLNYETEKWSYGTPMPNWAEPPTEGEQTVDYMEKRESSV